MIEIKADGQAEMRLLELLYPAPSALPAQSGSVLVAAETQRRIDDLTYLVQTQQTQLEQAQLVLNDYQQSFAALTGSPQAQQPALPPAAPSSADSNSAAPPTSRRYITGGLGRGDDAITVSSQTSQTAQTGSKPSVTHARRRPYFWPVGRSGRLTRIGLILGLSALTGWGVFKYAAPPIGSWLFPEPTTSISEPTEASEPAKKTASEATPEPQSNLSENAVPGSAANKAGTLPAIPTAPRPALEQAN